MAKSSTVKKSNVSVKSSKKTIVSKTNVKSKAKPAAKAKSTKIAVAKKPVKAVKVTKKPAKTTIKLAAKAVAKKVAPKVVAKKVAPKAVVKPVVAAPAPKVVAKAPAAPAPSAPKAVAPVAALATSAKGTFDFKVNDYLVYPTHGVGNVTAIEKTEIAGTQITLYVLNFEKEKMTLRVPVTRAASVGLRRLSSSEQITKALSVLKGKPKTARGMWSRRATEYGQKINSGNIEAIAQVVRDLHKNVDDPDRSYSERVIYESAFDRLCGEYAAVNKIDTKQAQEILVKALNKKAA